MKNSVSKMNRKPNPNLVLCLGCYLADYRKNDLQAIEHGKEIDHDSASIFVVDDRTNREELAKTYPEGIVR